MDNQFLYCWVDDTQNDRNYEFLRSEHNGKAMTNEVNLGTFFFATVQLLPLLFSNVSEEKICQQAKSILQEDVYSDFLIECYRNSRFNIEALRNYYNFIDLCFQDKSHCSTEDLSRFCAMTGIALKGGVTIALGAMPFDGVLIPEQIHNQLDSIKRPENTTIFELFGKNDPIIKGVLRFYVLSSIQDLLSASLQEIFNASHVIKRCAYCGRLFIPSKRNDVKYCETLWPENRGKTCGELAKKQKQVIREKECNSEKIHKSIRTMLSHKSQSTKFPDEEEILVEQLKFFNEESKEMRQLVKFGKYEEEDYIEWMKGYWAEVKADAKKRKRERRLNNP